ncbi:FAD-binding oxidoreductase, partial [Candidatus Aerophobetes bacterium]|nr:FAD-binding oxidoreductase [Candidatus Aerophobetes bacterium]
DVTIVGGGVIGCSIAYHLAKRGAKVLVIEKKKGFSFGASGTNHGGCPLQLFEPPVLELARESLKLYKNLSEEIGYDIEYDNVGALVCSIDEKQYLDMKNHAQSKQKEGINVRLIERDELQKLEPTLGEDVVVGIEEWESCSVNPFKVNYGFAYAAKKLGAKFLLSTEIKEIKKNKNRVISVITDKEKITTNFLVDSAGAWSSQIGKMVDLVIPVRPRKGQIIVTEPTPFNIRWRYISDADYLTTAFNLEATEKSKDVRIRLGVAGVYLQENTGNWTIGSSRDFAGYDTKVTMQVIGHIAKRAIKFMPKLKHVSCIRTFAGLRPFCYIDGLPILGKVDNPQNFVIATGHAGEGITLAPITGKLISELIVENKTSMPIDAFSFSRFKDEDLKKVKLDCG